jgi:hypothetical protein
VNGRFTTASYVHIESLWESEKNARVFNLMFFDDDEEIVGGAELTNGQIYWDDEETANNENTNN